MTLTGVWVVLGEAHVAVGDDPDDAAVLTDHRKARDLVALLQFLGVGESLVGAQRDRVVDDAGLEPLDPAHLRRLLLDVEVAMDHPDSARLRHRESPSAIP